MWIFSQNFRHFFKIFWNLSTMKHPTNNKFCWFFNKNIFYSPKKAKMQLFQWSRTDIKHPKSNKICWFFQLKKFVLKKVKISMFQCHCNDPKHLKKQWKMLISSVQRKYFVRSKKSKNSHVSMITYWSETSKNAIKYVGFFSSTKIFFRSKKKQK